MDGDGDGVLMLRKKEDSVAYVMFVLGLRSEYTTLFWFFSSSLHLYIRKRFRV